MVMPHCFMSEDPKLFDAGDYNLYRYCHNDPLDHTDPMGLGVDWQVPPSNLVALNLQTAMKQLQRQLADLTERAQSTSEMEHSYLGSAWLQQGFQNWRTLARQALTLAQVLRKTTNESSTSRAASNGSSSAIERAMKLPLDSSYRDTGQPDRRGVYFTHYGPGRSVGGWDPNEDPYTNRGLGMRGIRLDKDSLAISRDIARANHLQLGGPIYVNGRYLGNYVDQPHAGGRIDVYDPGNFVRSVNWGGILWGASVSGGP
jgi:hypothetical protein